MNTLHLEESESYGNPTFEHGHGKEEKAPKGENVIPLKENLEGVQLAESRQKACDELAIIRKQLKFAVDSNPSWPVSIILGLQQYLIMFGPTFAVPVILAPLLCIEGNVGETGKVINTMFVMSGMSTLLQIFFGTRLPIIQSGSYVFFAVAAGILDSKTCAEEDDDFNWHTRMAQLQGNLMIGSLLQMIVGGFGLVGFLLKVIGPITITVLILLIGLCLADVAARSASGHWGISIGMVLFITLFSEYLKDVPIPFPAYSKSKGFYIKWIKVFSSISIILSLAIMWTLCGILTETDTFPVNSPARTTNLTARLAEADWFYFPYPGQFGMPQVTLAGFVGMLAAVIAGIIESIGDYYACAKLSGAPPPPKYVLNRGILMEGVGCFLTGVCGPGIGVASYSENIGAIGLTKVGSIRVIFCSSIFMLIIGMIGKIGIIFASLPAPIVGGMYLVMFGIISAVGISNLQFVDLTSSRNVFIIGVSLYIGLVVPMWAGPALKDPIQKAAMSSGSADFDQLVAVILQSGMIIGAVIACILDNTIPGTDEERGMTSYKLATEQSVDVALTRKIYHEPLMEKLALKFPILRKLPFVNQ